MSLDPNLANNRISNIKIETDLDEESEEEEETLASTTTLVIQQEANSSTKSDDIAVINLTNQVKNIFY